MVFVWIQVYLCNSWQNTKSENSVFAQFVDILQSKCKQELYHWKDHSILYRMRFVNGVLKRRSWVILWHPKNWD